MQRHYCDHAFLWHGVINAKWIGRTELIGLEMIIDHNLSRLTINASPHKVPIAHATRKRSTSWYDVDLANGTIAMPTRPHIDIRKTDRVADAQANNTIFVQNKKMLYR